MMSVTLITVSPLLEIDIEIKQKGIMNGRLSVSCFCSVI